MEKFASQMFVSLGHRPHSSNVPTMQSTLFQSNKNMPYWQKQCCIKNINQLLAVFHTDFFLHWLLANASDNVCVHVRHIWSQKALLSVGLNPSQSSKWQNKLLASSAHCWGDATAYIPAYSGHRANLVMRGELRFSPPHLTLAVCQEPRYLSFLLLVGLVILKSCLLSHYF